eukprot:snap_masked-scaffold_13-processed-gene-11.57-mRNA-1 protein AED:1.00 eAED:1.00 QI:0/-1/0/0/-1/1/1/0/107
MAGRKIWVTNAVNEVRSDLQRGKSVSDSKHGFDIKINKLTNLYEYIRDSIIIQQWIIHPKVNFYRGGVNNFIRKSDTEVFEVIKLDPPYRLMAKNQIRWRLIFTTPW